MALRRRALSAVACVALAAAAVLVGSLRPPEAAAVGPGDVLGDYLLKLRGDGFDRSADSGRVDEGTIRGRAVMSVTRAAPDGDPRELDVRISLERSLDGSLLDRATPTPALKGRGILVGDSLTVIGAGQANFVNAVTLRFQKRGKRVDGVWLASYPGAEAESGFAAGIGLTFRGKRLRGASPDVLSATSR